MTQVRARSGHIFTVSDAEAAAHWVGLGYELVEEKPERATARKSPARKAPAKKSDDK